MADAAANRRRCTDPVAALPEEIIHEVLLRVGNVKDLFMLAVTCRRWLRRFTDPAFLRGLCPGQGDGHRARLLGFFLQQTRFFRYSMPMMTTRMAQRTSVFAPAFLPTPGSPLGLTQRVRALTAFVADDDGTFNYAVPLMARRGNVLMDLAPRTTDGRNRRSYHLGLCNPITGERHVLPPMECGIRSGVCGYAIITSADSELDGEQPPSSSRHFTFSQLFLIVVHEDRQDRKLYLHSYSAATRSWSAPTLCFQNKSFSMTDERSAIVHKGAAHWLFEDKYALRDDNNLYLLKIKVSTARSSLTNLPIRGGRSPYLSVYRDGKLVVAFMYLSHVIVWTQQGGDGGGATGAAQWIRTIFRIPIFYRDIPQQRPMEKWFTLNKGSMLVMYRSSGVFILDLEKKVMEKVMDCFLSLTNEMIFQLPVPYEVDLVEFFVLQLGNLCKG